MLHDADVFSPQIPVAGLVRVHDLIADSLLNERRLTLRERVLEQAWDAFPVDHDRMKNDHDSRAFAIIEAVLPSYRPSCFAFRA